MPTSFALTPHFENFIQEQLGAGRYNNASEVVRDALRLLESQQNEEALKLQGLRRAVADGFAALDAGQYAELAVDDIEAHVQALGAPPPPPKRSRGKAQR